MKELMRPIVRFNDYFQNVLEKDITRYGVLDICFNCFQKLMG